MPGSGLFPHRSQTHTWTHNVSRLLPIPSDVPDQCLDPQRSWLRPTPSEVPDSCLAPQSSFLPTPSELSDAHPDWQRSWLRPSSWEVLDSFSDPQGSWLRSTPLNVQDSCLDPQQFLSLAHSMQKLCSCTCSSGVRCLWTRLLAQSYLACQCPTTGLDPGFCSHKACFLRPTPS